MVGHNLSVTIDIEDWYHTPAVTGSPFSRYRDVDTFFEEWRHKRYDRLTGPTNKILKLLDEFEIKATFFIVADVVEHYPGLVESIAEKGHEIACHGLHHACKIDPGTKMPLISREEFERRTVEARSILEKATNKKVIGYRSPNAYVAGWIVDSLEKLGFKYDSSVCMNSFYNKTDSTLEHVRATPYYTSPGGLTPAPPDVKRKIIEYPWPYLDLAGIKFPTAGGPLLRFLGSGYIGMGLRQCVKNSDTLFYFHPIDISDEKFPDGFSSKRPFYWLIKGGIIEKRIRKILRSYNKNAIRLSDRKETAN